MIRSEVTGRSTHTKIEGDGEDILDEYRAISKNMYELALEVGMLPEEAKALIHITAEEGIKMAEENEND